MKREVFRVVGLVYSLVGLLVFLLNIINLIVFKTSISAFMNSIYFGIGLVLLLLSLSKREFITFCFRKKRVEISIKRLSCLIQYYIMVLICIVGILDAHDGQYNLSMVIITGLMGLKYRILGRKYLIAMIIFFAALFQVSASLSGLYMRGLYILLFSAFFFGISIIMYQEDLKRHFRLAKNYHDKLLHLEHIIEKFKGETVDISSINFTPRELEVLTQLCLTHPSNQELAETMGVTVQTIKTHIRNIFDKSGVDDRYQLIDLFKHNFAE